MQIYIWIAAVVFVAAATCWLTWKLARKLDQTKEEPVGTLRIADDPDDGPYLFLELHTSPEELYSRDTVVFWVDNMPYEAFAKTGVSIDEAVKAVSDFAHVSRSQ